MLFLEVDQARVPPATVTRRVPVEAEAPDSDGVAIHVLLHVPNGYLSELEIFREDGERLIQMPATETLNVFSLDESLT